MVLTAALIDKGVHLSQQAVGSARVIFLVPAQDPPVSGCVRAVTVQSLAIDTDQLLPVDTAVMFDLPFGAHDVIRIRGIVSWTRDQALYDRPAGFGVHFVGLSAGAKRSLQRLVDGLGPAPAPQRSPKPKAEEAAKPKRASSSYRMDVLVVLRLPKADPPIQATVRDYGPRGLFLSSTCVLEVGDRVSFILESRSARVRVRGRVVDFQADKPENHFEIRFKAMKPEELLAVQQATLTISKVPEPVGDTEIFGWDE